MATVIERNGTYKITVSCGYDSTGKQIRKAMTWNPSPNMTQKQIGKELERQKVLFEEKCRTGQFLNSSIKFSELADIWFKDYAETQLAPKTVLRYRDFIKRINPAIGHIKLDKLQPHHLLELYNSLSADGVNQATGSGLSAQTILHHHRLISKILNTAVEWGTITSNPAARVKPPKVPHKEANYLDDKQAVELLEFVQSEPLQYQVMITLLLYTGMRSGEMCGLEWKDIDFDNQIITIRRVSQYLPKKGTFTKEPKNKSSIRSSKYPQFLIDLLQEYRAWQSEQRLMLGDRWVDTDRLFTQWNGIAIYPGTPAIWFGKFVKKYNLPHITIHSLRHTNATLLIAGGTDIRTVSKRLGHSQTSTTMNIYAHAIRSADEAAAETIQNILYPNNKNLA